MRKLKITFVASTVLTWTVALSMMIVSTAALAADATSETTSNTTSMQQRVEQLEKELQALKSELNKPGVAIKKSTRFEYGGYIKLNAMWSDYSDGARATAGLGDEILVPSLIPVGGDGDDSRFDSHIKTSRFWFKTNTDTEIGPFNTHFELDLLTSSGNERISNSSFSRVRHAYVNWHYAADASLLAGQTWSTFFNVGVLPETIDFIGPTSGVIFNRQAQLRWTKKLAHGSVMLAAENPSTGLYDGGGSVGGNNFDDNSIPDIVVRYNAKRDQLSYSAAIVGREIAYDVGTSDDDSYGYGISVAGKYLFNNGDDLKFMVSQGQLGRYIALNAFRDGVVRADGSIDSVDSFGAFVAYRHFWNKKLRSTVSYAMAQADLPNSVAVTSTSEVSNFNINLLYSPIARLSFGVEYIDAERELENGDKGDLTRVQFMTRYVF